VIDAKTALQHGLIQDVFETYAFEEKLETLKNSLTLNNRPFIEYVKKSVSGSIGDEIEPFGRFWESEEHLKRVDEFLSRKEV